MVGGRRPAMRPRARPSAGRAPATPHGKPWRGSRLRGLGRRCPLGPSACQCGPPWTLRGPLREPSRACWPGPRFAARSSGCQCRLVNLTRRAAGAAAAQCAAGAAAGLLAGAALRGPVFRLSVPTGEPDQTACRGCGAPVSRWLAIRCGDCGRSLGVPAVLELATAAVLALLLGRFGGQPDMVAFGFLGALGVALAAIDIAVQRLPDRLTLPAFPVLVVLLAVAAAIGHDGGALVRALLGSVALAGGYLLLALARPGQLGGGDIKLAALAGLALGWLGGAPPGARGRPRLLGLEGDTAEP